jgi:alpha-ketoglutarate-dependent taurine dioxygenase
MQVVKGNTERPLPASNHFRVSPELARGLQQWAVAQLPLPEAISGRLAYAQAAAYDLQQLPEYARLIGDIRAVYAEYRAVVVEGLPVVPNIAQLYLAFSAGLVTPYDQYGDIPYDIAITTDDRATYQAAAPRNFELHADYAFVPEIPETTVILCTQPDPNYPHYGASTLLSGAEIVSGLQAEGETELLDFLVNTPINFALDNDPTQSFTRPILAPVPHTPGEYYACYRRRFMPADFKDQYGALLDRFEAFCDRHAYRFTLAKGDLLLFSNRRWLHGRGPCTTTTVGEGGEAYSRHILLMWGYGLAVND